MKPLKVMIVDDEILAIQDLERLVPWEERGFQIAATATNSAKALELYEKHYPQLVFIDIRMPIMDGLQLSQQLFALGRPVKIILLTAYRDFDYAKKALELGISNYLLKHDLNAVSLTEELDKIRRELEEESEKERIIRGGFLRNIIEGKTFETGISQKETFVYQNPDFNYTLLLLVPNLPLLEPLQKNNSPALEPTSFYSLDFPEYVFDYDILSIAGNFIFVFIIRKTNSQSESRERMFFLGGLIQSQLSKMTSQTFSIILNPTCKDQTGLATLYQKAISVLPYLYFYERAKIIHMDDLSLPVAVSKISQNMIDETLGALSNSLHGLNSEHINGQIKTLFKAVTYPVWHPEGLKKVCQQLLYLLEHFQHQHHFQSFEKRVTASEIASNVYTVNELCIWFSQQFEFAIEQVKTFNQPDYSKKTKQAVQYIQEHYGDDLTAEKVAEQLGFSGVYLSQLFKKETGKTFLEYLTDYRIEIAKNLLQSGDYKIYEVAERVGYKTSQYFSQVFRKVTGVYPIDYRERGSHP